MIQYFENYNTIVHDKKMCLFAHVPVFLVSTFVVRTGFLPLVPSSVLGKVGDLLSARVERVPAGVPFCCPAEVPAGWVPVRPAGDCTAAARVVRTGDLPRELLGETCAGDDRLIPRSVTFLLYNMCHNIHGELIYSP